MIVYLHIGTPKSGTTYLQAVLEHNRNRLAQDGVLWPGRNWADQVLAVRDQLDINPHGDRPPEAEGAWQRLLDEIDAWSGHAAVISMEWLISAPIPRIRAAVEALAPHDVRVIITARDLARTVPSQWQEEMKNWQTWTWEAYLADLSAEEPRYNQVGRRLLNQHDLTRALGTTWGSVVPTEQMCVVTVPPPGVEADRLWQRFAAAIGIDPEGYEAHPKFSNGSLGAASAEVMRRVNLATQDRGMRWGDGERVLKWVATNTLSGRSSHEPRPTLPVEYHAWAEEQAKAMIAEVERLGVPVFGNLADLIPAAPSQVPQEVTSRQLADAAVDGLAGLSMHMAGELKRLGSKVDAANRERDAALAAMQEHREIGPVERIKRCVVELGGQLAVMRVLLAGYRRIRGLVRRAR